jgi:deoxyadenosine/deoxycytidine kinase
MASGLVTLEGNIGAGKTTLLRRIGQELDHLCIPHVVLYEPVEQWMRPACSDGKSLFELYYADKREYGFRFQMHVLQTRLSHLLQSLRDNPGKLVVCERCHLTDGKVFAALLRKMRLVSEVDHFVYTGWYETCCSLLDPYLKGVIYLRATPTTCVERIKSRNRSGEESIGLDYISQLHSAHEDWLMQAVDLAPSPSELPVVVVDGDVAASGPKMDVTVSSIGEFLSRLSGSLAQGSHL